MRFPPKKMRETGVFREVWQKINELIDHSREISITSGRGIRVARTANGTQLTVEEKAVDEAVGVVERATVQEVHGDYLVCLTTEDGETLNVAKPPQLRRTTFHGLSVDGFTWDLSLDGLTRTGVASATARTQEAVDPTYTPGVTQIWIARFESSATVIGDFGEDLTVEHIDLNVDARRFEMARKQVAVCISNDNNWRMYIRASDPFRP